MMTLLLTEMAQQKWLRQNGCGKWLRHFDYGKLTDGYGVYMVHYNVHMRGALCVPGLSFRKLYHCIFVCATILTIAARRSDKMVVFLKVIC